MGSPLPNSIVVYLVRHGETKGNIERSFLPPTEDLLTEKGQNQAKQLGIHLANVKFTAAYSSTYQRTFDTARIVLEQSNVSNELSGKVQQDERIKERDVGIFEGKPYRQIVGEVIKTQKHISEFIVPEGETNTELYSRANSFLKEIFTKAFNEKNNTKNEQTLLIVSHALFISTFMRSLNEPEAIKNDYKVIGWEENCKILLTNTSYMQLEITEETGGKFQLKFVKIHEKSHLGTEQEEEVDHDPGNAALRKFIAEDPNGRFLTNCIQA